MFYMQKGIYWVPNYLVTLRDDGKADVRLRATVMNDIEDFEDTELNFVVGVPTFRYSQVSSPLSSTESVAQFMNSLARGAAAARRRHRGQS